MTEDSDLLDGEDNDEELINVRFRTSEDMAERLAPILERIHETTVLPELVRELAPLAGRELNSDEALQAVFDALATTGQVHGRTRLVVYNFRGIGGARWLLPALSDSPWRKDFESAWRATVGDFEEHYPEIGLERAQMLLENALASLERHTSASPFGWSDEERLVDSNGVALTFNRTLGLNDRALERGFGPFVYDSARDALVVDDQRWPLISGSVLERLAICRPANLLAGAVHSNWSDAVVEETLFEQMLHETTRELPWKDEPVNMREMYDQEAKQLSSGPARNIEGRLETIAPHDGPLAGVNSFLDKALIAARELWFTEHGADIPLRQQEGLEQDLVLALNMALGLTPNAIARGATPFKMHDSLPCLDLDYYEWPLGYWDCDRRLGSLTQGDLRDAASRLYSRSADKVGRALDAAWNAAADPTITALPEITLRRRSHFMQARVEDLIAMASDLDQQYSRMDTTAKRPDFCHFGSPFGGATTSGLKLHIYCESYDDVLEVLRRVFPIARDRGIDGKFVRADWFQQQHTSTQANKGITLYLPDRATAQVDTDIIVRAMEGYRHADGQIPGNRFLANGVSYRYAYAKEPGRNLTSAEERGSYMRASENDFVGPELYPPSPDHSTGISPVEGSLDL